MPLVGAARRASPTLVVSSWKRSPCGSPLASAATSERFPNYGAPMNLATVCYVLVSIAAVIYILDFLGVV